MTSIVNDNFRPRTRTGFPMDRYGPVAAVRASKNMRSPPFHAIVARSTALVRKIAGKIQYYCTCGRGDGCVSGLKEIQLFTNSNNNFIVTRVLCIPTCNVVEINCLCGNYCSERQFVPRCLFEYKNIIFYTNN